MPTLTQKQMEVLDAIRRHKALTGQAPTVRELGAAVNLRSSCSVQKHLDALEMHGSIKRSAFKYRSIEITGDYLTGTMGVIPVPVLGTVSAGVPAMLQEQPDPQIMSVCEALLSPPVDRRAQSEACASRRYNDAPIFALSICGKSMEGAGISDGDIVIVNKTAQASDGDIVIAKTSKGEATVKRYFKERGSVRLEPANPEFSTLVQRDVKIVGRVTLAIKKF
jgi:repressor LexA